jgi:hypothetical protein
VTVAVLDIGQFLLWGQSVMLSQFLKAVLCIPDTKCNWCVCMAASISSHCSIILR